MRRFLQPLFLSPLVFSAALLAAEPPDTGRSPVSKPGLAANAAKKPIAWRAWSDAAFAEAKASKKYVLMDLGANWCHWCHVMEATTYRDPAVVALIAKNFIPVHVDQDSRPDLSRRYEAYGWPATIILDGDGNDVGKLRGYREPERFVRALEGILKDPSPLFVAEDEDKDRKFGTATALSDAARKEVERRYRASLDMQIGGLKQSQRYLNRDTLEYSLALAERGDKEAARWARLTLDNAKALIDPAWGGMYQYSTDSDWKHPHYEKIMEIQANALRVYALGYKAFGDKAYLDSASAIARYVTNFLTSPEGAFYTSQDADRVPGEQGDSYFSLADAERRKLGMPRIDTHVYSRENGWMIVALVEYYGITGERKVLEQALKAATWVVAKRGNPDGSFRHDSVDKSGPFMGDTLAMTHAMLSLYTATADAQWLARARKGRAVLARYAAKMGAGYLPVVEGKSKLVPRANIDDNIEAARLGNLLYRYTGDAKDKAFAEVALRYIAHDEVAMRFGQIPGILQATQEAASDPLHITVVGPKSDADSQALFKAALAQPAVYRRVEWWDPAQGKLVNPDVTYPQLGRPAAFICTNKVCSSPLFKAEDLGQQVMQLLAVGQK